MPRSMLLSQKRQPNASNNATPASSSSQSNEQASGQQMGSFEQIQAAAISIARNNTTFRSLDAASSSTDAQAAALDEALMRNASVLNLNRNLQMRDDSYDSSFSDDDDTIIGTTCNPLMKFAGGQEEAHNLLQDNTSLIDAATHSLLQLQQAGLNSPNNQSQVQAHQLYQLSQQLQGIQLQQQQQHRQQQSNQLHNMSTSATTSVSASDQQMDSLTKAIIYFVGLFSQQQQKIDMQQQEFKINLSSLSESCIQASTTDEPQQLGNSQTYISAVPTQSRNRSAGGRLSQSHNVRLRNLRHTQLDQQQQPRTSKSSSNEDSGNVLGTQQLKIDLGATQKQQLNQRDQNNNNISSSSSSNSSSSSSSGESSTRSNSSNLTFMDVDDSNSNASGVANKRGGSSTTSNSGNGENFVHYCRDCGKRYTTSSNLARHRQTHRDVTDKKAKKCPECDKIYVSMPAFSMHLRTHSQGCICSICGKSFSRPWLLQGHMRTHTGEKPFSCKICNKAFADKSNLRAHVQTHSTTKPHVCERCNKAFALKSYLCKHVESTCMRTNGGNPQKEPLNLKVSSGHSRRNRSMH